MRKFRCYVNIPKSENRTIECTLEIDAKSDFEIEQKCSEACNELLWTLDNGWEEIERENES